MKTALTESRVYLILDPSMIGDRSLVDTTRALVAAGARLFQLRDKKATARQLVDLSRQLLPVIEAANGLLLVNDRLDVALAAGAHGVHLGPHDISVADARNMAPGLVIGGSAATVERAHELEQAGADYLGCGAVYEARAMKPDASAPQGPEFVRAVVSAVGIPVFGIGGITVSNAGEVVEAGAQGVAVIRTVLAADDPVAAFARLAACVQR